MLNLNRASVLLLCFDCVGLLWFRCCVVVRFVRRRYFNQTRLLFIVCGKRLVAFFLLSGCNGFAEPCVECEYVQFVCWLGLFWLWRCD